MAQSCKAKPPFTDSNYSLPQSIVKRHDNEPLGDDKPSPLMPNKTEAEPPRKGDIFKRVIRKSLTAAPASQNSITENSLTERAESQVISSIPSIETSEPLKPPSISIFKKLSCPPVTTVPAITSTDAVNIPSQPVMVPSTICRKPLFITPVKKPVPASILQSVSLDTIPLGSIASTTKSTAVKLSNSSSKRYHKLTLDRGSLQKENDQATSLQSTEVLRDLTGDLLTSATQRIEPLEDYIGSYKGRTTASDFDDDLSDII